MDQDEWEIDARIAEAYGREGDEGRCPLHPGIVTRSASGLHDAPCVQCEAEIDEGGEW